MPPKSKNPDPEPGTWALQIVPPNRGYELVVSGRVINTYQNAHELTQTFPVDLARCAMPPGTSLGRITIMGGPLTGLVRPDQWAAHDAAVLAASGAGGAEPEAEPEAEVSDDGDSE